MLYFVYGYLESSELWPLKSPAVSFLVILKNHDYFDSPL